MLFTSSSGRPEILERFRFWLSPFVIVFEAHWPIVRSSVVAGLPLFCLCHKLVLLSVTLRTTKVVYSLKIVLSSTESVLANGPTVSTVDASVRRLKESGTSLASASASGCYFQLHFKIIFVIRRHRSDDQARQKRPILKASNLCKVSWCRIVVSHRGVVSFKMPLRPACVDVCAERDSSRRELWIRKGSFGCRFEKRIVDMHSERGRSMREEGRFNAVIC